MSVKFVSNINVDGNITSDSFIKDGGTSSQFLKADGSIDTNTYTTNAGTVGGNGAVNRLPKFSTGGNDVENSTISDDGTDVTLSEGRILLNDTTFNQIKSSGDTQYVGTTNGVNTLKVGTATTGWKSVTTDAGSSEWVNGGTAAASLNHTNGNMSLEGSITADSIIKDGGTSAQFLKADGSVDTTTYATGTIPTNNTQLTNGANYITSGDIPTIPTNNNQLTNGENYITAGDIPTIPTNNNQLTNGENYITSASLPTDFVSAASGGTFAGTVKFDGTFGNLDTVNDKGMQFEIGTTALNTLRTDADAFRIWFGGTSSNGESLKITQNGLMTLKTSGSTEFQWDLDGDFHADGDVIAYSTTVSDRNLKENITTIDNATETVEKLRGVQYEWKQGSGKREGQTEIGVIAQEVEEVLPFLVREKKVKDNVVKTVDYEKMIGLLIESNKELSARLRKLECGCSTCDCK